MQNKLQKEVAVDLGVERSTYVRWENGQTEPPIDMLIKLADYFCVTLDYLCEHEPKIPPKPPEQQVKENPRFIDEKELSKKIEDLENQVSRINLSLMMLKNQKGSAKTLPQIGFKNFRPAGTVVIGGQAFKSLRVPKSPNPVQPPLDDESFFPQISVGDSPTSVEMDPLAARLLGLSPDNRKRVYDFINSMDKE